MIDSIEAMNGFSIKEHSTEFRMLKSFDKVGFVLPFISAIVNAICYKKFASVTECYLW